MTHQQPRHLVTFMGENVAGARATMVSWDYTRTEPATTALKEAIADLRAKVDLTAVVTGGIALMQADPLYALPHAVKLMSPVYYTVKAFGEAIVSHERLRKEIERLTNQPQVFTRVCGECGGGDLEFRGESHNLLSYRVRRVCTRCGCERTRLTNGTSPLFLYNGYELTKHMRFFGTAEGKMILGIDTTQGWGSESEIGAIRRMLLG